MIFFWFFFCLCFYDFKNNLMFLWNKIKLQTLLFFKKRKLGRKEELRKHSSCHSRCGCISCSLKHDIKAKNVFFFISVFMISKLNYNHSYSERKFFLRLKTKILNLTTSDLRVIPKVKNIEGCQSMSKKQLEELKY